MVKGEMLLEITSAALLASSLACHQPVLMALQLPLRSMETRALFQSTRFCLNPQFSSMPYLPSATARFFSSEGLSCRYRRRRLRPLASVGKEETELRVSAEQQQEVSPEDLEYVRQIQRILELLRKNRDMTVGEVKLTMMIEDPREAERKRLLGIEDANEISREDLAAALEDVHEGRIPDNHVALRLLAEEMMQWPKLEVEPPKSKPRRSLYAKATDTGVDPQEASRRLKMDWNSAVETGTDDESGDLEVPSALGYGALYLVTALPVLIGISVVLVLFYNSLQ